MQRKSHKKRAYAQRYQAVILALSKATYQMTGHEIARDMGYANGNPLKEVVEQLIDEGLVVPSDGKMFGRPCVYLWMPKDKRKIALKQIGYEE